MEKPLVSVVMPSYNHAEFVGKAIESVLNQTYSNFEFIIADDGSSDNSAEVIRQYKDPRIRFTAFKNNTCFGTCEYVYENVKGKYIAAICSDDIWQNTILEKYVAFMEEHEEYGCCFCRPLLIDDKGELVYDENKFAIHNLTKEEWFRLSYMNGNQICGPSMCIRSSLFERLGPFKLQFRQLQDYELWLRLFQISNIYIYPEELVLYRKHGTGSNCNMSTPTDDVVLRDILERKYILLDIMENLEEEFFIKAFYNDLMLHPEDENFNTECEKFGVMLKAAPFVPVESAVFYYYRHYNDKKFRDSIETVYHISRKDLWNLAGADHNHTCANERNIKKIEELNNTIQILREKLQEQEKELEMIRG